jgi:hypothetical protein
MPVVSFGNPAGLDGGRQIDGESVTTATLPDSWSTGQRFRGVTAVDGIWRNHSGASAPTWIESDDPDLADALSEHYGCPVGRPDKGKE